MPSNRSVTNFNGTTQATSRSIPHTVNAGSNNVLYAICDTGPASGNISACDFNGDTCTEIYDDAPADTFQRIFIFRLLNPDVGTFNLNLTTDNTNIIVTIISYSDVNQITPNGSFTTSATSGHNVSSAVGDIVISIGVFGGAGGFTLTPNAGTELGDQTNTFAGNEMTVGVAQLVGAASVTIDWSQDSGVDDYAVIGFEINDQPAAGVTFFSSILPNNARSIPKVVAY